MELPKTYPVYFERRKFLMLIVLFIAIISGIITYYSFKSYTVYHIYSAFICAVSTLYLSWLYFNPLIVIEKDFFELNTGLFLHRKFQYRDIQKIDTNENTEKLYIVYNDHEVIEISMRLIKKDERIKFVEILKLHVYKDLLDRDG
jgi:hypothetical protein